MKACIFTVFVAVGADYPWGHLKLRMRITLSTDMSVCVSICFHIYVCHLNPHQMLSGNRKVI